MANKMLNVEHRYKNKNSSTICLSPYRNRWEVFDFNVTKYLSTNKIKKVFQWKPTSKQATTNGAIFFFFFFILDILSNRNTNFDLTGVMCHMVDKKVRCFPPTCLLIPPPHHQHTHTFGGEVLMFNKQHLCLKSEKITWRRSGTPKQKITSSSHHFIYMRAHR